MYVEWLSAITALMIAGATIFAAKAARTSAQAARDSREILKWQINGANVHAIIEWTDFRHDFRVVVQNDGPEVAYGVYADGEPDGESFDGSPPEIDSNWHSRIDISPNDRCTVHGVWRQHSEHWMRVRIYWHERADDDTARPRERLLRVYRPSPPPAQ